MAKRLGVTAGVQAVKATAPGSSENLRFSWSRESKILERLDPGVEADQLKLTVEKLDW